MVIRMNKKIILLVFAVLMFISFSLALLGISFAGAEADIYKLRFKEVYGNIKYSLSINPDAEKEGTYLPISILEKTGNNAFNEKVDLFSPDFKAGRIFLINIDNNENKYGAKEDFNNIESRGTLKDTGKDMLNAVTSEPVKVDNSDISGKYSVDISYLPKNKDKEGGKQGVETEEKTGELSEDSINEQQEDSEYLEIELVGMEDPVFEPMVNYEYEKPHDIDNKSTRSSGPDKLFSTNNEGVVIPDEIQKTDKDTDYEEVIDIPQDDRTDNSLDNKILKAGIIKDTGNNNTPPAPVITSSSNTTGMKVEICHIPPGNPDNAHTIEVGKSAVAAHIAHGDYLGMCNNCPTDPDKGEPGICGCGVADTDSDRDGIANCNDNCPNDANKTAAGVCGCGIADTDSDSDGTADCNDECVNDSSKTQAGICGCGMTDTDLDGDGTADCNDNCPNDANKIVAGICGCGVADTDSDGDGTANCNDSCPNDANKTAAGVCGCGIADTDSDSDGTADCNDECVNDSSKTQAGICGCGMTDTDSDGDGTADCNDNCPNDANKTAAGICGCGIADTDSDSDGTADCNDACVNDSSKTQAGICGCGVTDTDSDGDGVADCNDNCPNDSVKSGSGVCGCNVSDYDSDADGIPDCIDNCPDYGNTDQADTDDDGIGNACEIIRDRFYAVEPSAAVERLITIDPDTAEVNTVLNLSGAKGFQSNSLAFSPDNELYGWDATNSRLYKIDLSTGEVIRIGNGPAMYQWVNGLAFDEEGKLYGLNGGTDELLSIDTNNGAISVIGDLGIDIKHNGMAYDFDTGELYGLSGFGTDADYLFRIYKELIPVFSDDFSSNTTGNYTWSYKNGAPHTSYEWDSAGHVRMDGVEEVYCCWYPAMVEAQRTVNNIPSSGYAKIKFNITYNGDGQSRVFFFIKQDEDNWYKFVGTDGTYGSTGPTEGVEKKVNGVVETFVEDTHHIDSTGEYIMEVWWGPARLRMDINGLTVRDVQTSDTTVLSPASFSFRVYRYHANWDYVNIYDTSALAEVIGPLGVDGGGAGLEFNPVTSELFSIREMNRLMKINIYTGEAIDIDMLGEGALTTNLAAPWPDLTVPGDDYDGDGDGIADSHDNCPLTFNTNQIDSDDDWIGDVCDNCISTYNYKQLDADNDGVGDACDTCWTTSNTDQADRDGDGVEDVCDNCESVPNANQADDDSDGTGNLCEEDYVVLCPEGASCFQFNDPAGSASITDDADLLFGTVSSSNAVFLGDGYFHGDGNNGCVVFENNDESLKATTGLIVEARIKPTGLEGTDNYIRRILARDGGGNYQMSVWRNNSLWATYNAPAGTASIAFWLKPLNSYGGQIWKPVLTDYNVCPIVSDHWYKVKVTWDSGKTGGIPADIFLEDQGFDGNGTGSNWTGYKNCTDSDQLLLPADRYLYEGDEITGINGDFTVGCNVNNHANNVFNGLIDWITVLPTSEVDSGPLVKSGDLIISEVVTYNGAIYSLDPNTGVLNLLATGDPVHHPEGLAITYDGKIVVADWYAWDTVTNATSGPRSIYEIDPATGSIDIILSGSPLITPIGVEVADDGNLIVIDHGTNQAQGKVLKIDYETGEVMATNTHGQLYSPQGIARDDATGDIYVVDHNGYVFHVDQYTLAISNIGRIPHPTQAWPLPQSLIVTDTGKLMVATILGKIYLMDPATGISKELFNDDTTGDVVPSESNFDDLAWIDSNTFSVVNHFSAGDVFVFDYDPFTETITGVDVLYDDGQIYGGELYIPLGIERY